MIYSVWPHSLRIAAQNACAYPIFILGYTGAIGIHVDMNVLDPILCYMTHMTRDFIKHTELNKISRSVPNHLQ